MGYLMKALFVVTIAVFCLSCSAMAQDENEWRSWPLADHFTITLDGFFPNLDTQVRVDASDASPGTAIDFEQNLGMSDTETFPAIGFSWRFAKKHQLRLKVFELNRSGSAITPTDISFGDETFTVNLPISSFFDMSVIGLSYSYSLVFDQKKELGVGVGLSVQDISFGLIGDAGQGIIETDLGITVPLPTFDIKGRYAFTDKWIGKLGIGVFSLDLAISDEEDLRGEVFNGYVAIQHNTFEHVYFELGYSFVDVKAAWKKNSLVNAIGYEYHGPVLSVTAAF